MARAGFSPRSTRLALAYKMNKIKLLKHLSMQIEREPSPE
jgi:hypothetical protein